MNEKMVKQDKMARKRVMGFQVVEDECIWMKAGIVNFRLCDNAYDCYNCPFDRGMRKVMSWESPSQVGEERPGWIQYLRERYDGASRPCRHALTGRINAPKICTRNYECYHCPYDQMLDEEDYVQLVDAPSYRMVKAAFHVFVLGDQPLLVGYFLHNEGKLIRFERLEQVVCSPHFHGLDSRIDGTIGRNDDNNRIRVFLFHLSQNFNAVHAWHLDVHKQEVKRQFFQFFQCLKT